MVPIKFIFMVRISPVRSFTNQLTNKKYREIKRKEIRRINSYV